MEKFYGEAVFLEQPFVRDDKVTVEGFIKRQGKNIGGTGEVVRFVRYKLGEGMRSAPTTSPPKSPNRPGSEPVPGSRFSVLGSQ